MQYIIERVKQIILKPRETWETISKEETSIPDLYKNYLLILAAVPALASFLGRWIVGIRIPFAGVYHFGFRASLFNSIIGYVLTLVSVWIAGKVISYLAPNFGSVKDDAKGFQVAVYSYTPILVAGVLNLIPSLAVLIFFAGLYGLYILYIGLPIMMETPKEKSLPYTVVIIVVLILIYIIFGWITGAILGAFGPSLPKI
ncbi:YIP1 family protein [bacterium]|nr:YIP1 family protein [bacterium]